MHYSILPRSPLELIPIDGNSQTTCVVIRFPLAENTAFLGSFNHRVDHSKDTIVCRPDISGESLGDCHGPLNHAQNHRVSR